MSPIKRRQLDRGWGLAGQLGWTALALVHVAPLWKTALPLLTGEFAWGRFGACVGVAVAFSFFVLKALGVRLLKVRFHRAGLAAAVLGFALVHGDAAASAAKSNPGAAITVAALVEGAVVFSPRVRRALPEFLDGISKALGAALVRLDPLCRLSTPGAMIARSIDGVGRATARGPPV